MVSPRFVDSFETVSLDVLRARDSQNAAERKAFNTFLAPITVNQTQRFGNANYFRLDEQAKAYRYWTYIAINKISDRCAQQFPNIGLKTKRAKGQQSRIPITARQHLKKHYGRYLQRQDEDIEPLSETHPLHVLLQSVNPGETWGDFVSESVIHNGLMGVFTWWLIPNGFRTTRAPGGLPSQLMALPPQWVTPLYNEDRTFRCWEILPYADETMRFELPFEQIIIGKRKNPRSKALMEPYSPLQAAPAWIDNVESIERARRSGFEGGVNPDMLIELDPTVYDSPQPDIIARIKQRFMERAANLERRNGEPLLMPPGMKATKWSHTNKEMDFIDSAAQIRDNVLALHGVPPVVAGVTSDYTRATADAATVVFCDYTINPLLAFIAGVITEKLASLYDPRIVVWFDDCVPANAEFELKQDEADFQMGALDPDELRQKRGREPKGEPAYESGYLPHTLSPLNEDLQPEPLEAEDDPMGDEDGKDSAKEKPPANDDKAKE